MSITGDYVMTLTFTRRDRGTVEELERKISYVKSRKAAGLDGINSKLLKYSSTIFKFRLLN